MLRSISRLITIFSLLFGVSQCRWSEPPPSDTIVFGLSNEPKTLDPRYGTDANGQRINGLIFSSLVKIGAHLEIEGDLASSWSYKSKTYTFQLRPGIRFHDGTTATAEDFLFSFAEFNKPRSPFSQQFSVISKVTATYNPATGGELKIHMKKYWAPFLNDLPLIKLLPQKVVAAVGEDFYAQPIGSGPFAFHKKDVKNIYLNRFNDFFGDKPKAEKLQFKIIKDSNTRFQKMFKGKIDIVQSDIPFSKVRFFKDQKNFQVVTAPGLSTKYILLNLRHPILAQTEVRHAISSAIQRDMLIKYTMEGFAETATSIIPTQNPFFNKELKHTAMSDSQIRMLFKKMADKPLILKTSNTQEAVEVGKILTHQLRELGLPIEQQSYEWGTYYEDVKTGNFDLAVMKWVGINDPDIYRTSLHSKMTPPGRNRGYYNNSEFDRLVDRAIVEESLEKRKRLYHKAQEIVFSELPTIPLWYEKQVAITHKRVKNYSLPLNGDFSSLLDVYKDDRKNQ